MQLLPISFNLILYDKNGRPLPRAIINGTHTVGWNAAAKSLGCENPARVWRSLPASQKWDLEDKTIGVTVTPIPGTLTGGPKPRRFVSIAAFFTLALRGLSDLARQFQEVVTARFLPELHADLVADAGRTPREKKKLRYLGWKKTQSADIAASLELQKTSARRLLSRFARQHGLTTIECKSFGSPVKYAARRAGESLELAYDAETRAWTRFQSEEVLLDALARWRERPSAQLQLNLATA